VSELDKVFRQNVRLLARIAKMEARRCEGCACFSNARCPVLPSRLDGMLRAWPDFSCNRWAERGTP